MKQFLVFLITSTCMLPHGMAQKNTGSSLSALRTLLKTEGVKVQLLRVPDEVMTGTAVTPAGLRSMAYYTVTFKKDIANIFEPVLSGLSLKFEDHTPDLRWGVLFYDANNREIGSMFVDKFGRHGFLNGESVVFETGLLDGNVAHRLLKTVRNLR